MAALVADMIDVALPSTMPPRFPSMPSKREHELPVGKKLDFCSRDLVLNLSVDAGVSPSGKATDSDSVMRWFKSSHPSQLPCKINQL